MAESTPEISQPERATQERVIALFRDELGYRFLGIRAHRDGNSNIEEPDWTAFLKRCGHTHAQIAIAVHRFRTEADQHGRGLYAVQ
jgi:type I restriction enzyme R subunit